MVWEPGLSLKGKRKLNIISICLFLPPDYEWNVIRYLKLPYSNFAHHELQTMNQKYTYFFLLKKCCRFSITFILGLGKSYKIL